MQHIPTALYKAAQVRELDRIAIEEHGIAGIVLMERAGNRVWNELCLHFPEAKNICVVVGSGNNAGDGYEVARLAHESRFNVSVLTVSAPERLQGDAKTTADRLINTGINPQAFTTDALSNADVIVDAMLGTGIGRNVSGNYLQAITGINQSTKPVIAIDIPSGLDADTGQVMGSAVKATITITFIGLKIGLFTGQGPEHAGKVLFANLDIPEKIYQVVPKTAERIEYTKVNSLLQKRQQSAHKGDFGHVLLIGGDYGYAGAIRMAGEAAARTGAGLVSLATRKEHAVSILLSVPELMAHGITSALDLASLIERATTIAIGPGLGQGNWGMELLAYVLQSNLSMVVDADALNLIAKEASYSDNWILTPHPGEAARLLNVTVVEVQTDRLGAATALQKKFGGVIILKGSGTVIVDQQGQCFVCSAGNPGMATGGMGDVLTGILAGLLAQGFGASDAARLGVCLHAAAGDEAAKSGQRGMLATDLMPHLQRLANP